MTIDSLAKMSAAGRRYIKRFEEERVLCAFEIELIRLHLEVTSKPGHDQDVMRTDSDSSL